MMFDILVAGELNPDLILSGNVTPGFGQVETLVDSAALTVGSSSAIFACQAAKLGLEVAFMGVCGDDLFGRFMLDQLQARMVDISNVICVPGGQTGLSVILNQGADRAILTHIGLISALKAGDVTEDMLSQARHLHISSYFLQTSLQPDLPDLFTRARSHGLTTSLDTNWDPSNEWISIEDLLPLTDVFLPNENEALAISGASALHEALKILVNKCDVVAVKRGSHPAVAVQGVAYASVSPPSVSVVDTVGAGDNFDAGFLYGRLNRWSLEKSLALAVACGTLSTQAAGGVAAQPTLEEALNYVQLPG